MWKFSASIWMVAYKIKITLFTFGIINNNYMPHEKKPNTSTLMDNNFSTVF